jgi:hypothetical protein
MTTDWAKLRLDEKFEIVKVCYEQGRLYAKYINGRQEYDLEGDWFGPLGPPNIRKKDDDIS